MKLEMKKTQSKDELLIRSYLILSKFSSDVETLLSRQQCPQNKLMQHLNE